MNLWIGLSALRSSQFAINNVSHNLANASTEGYHRQEVGFQTNEPQYIRNQFIGNGVEISGVRRSRDQIIERAFTNSIADLSNLDQRLRIESQIESILLPGDGSIQNALTGMFDELSRLSANPGEMTLRNSVANQAANFSSRVRTASNELVELKESVSSQIELEVSALNQDIENLVDLQNRIRSSVTPTAANDLLDQRDQLVNSIAERVDVQRFEAVQQQLGLGIAGSSISIGAAPIRFETVHSESGEISIHVEGNDRETVFLSGKITALTEAHNRLIDDYRSKLDEFAASVIQAVDQAHSAGVGLDGPFSLLRGHRAVTDGSLPLNDAGLPFPVENGQLFISVIAPDGQRRTESIEIDPAVDSLDDVASRISALDNIQAVVNGSTGQFSIIAEPGYHFDFTGSLESSPALTNFTGTSVPSLQGRYFGDANQALSLRIVGDGEVGKTEGLKADLLDATGQVLRQFNIGNGYEAGSPIDLGDGAQILMGAGSVVDGDSFNIDLVANSDSSGILAALGLNSFFRGDSAANIEVSQNLLENPEAIATSRSGEIGDTSNVAGLVALRSSPLLADGRLTFDDFLGETTATIGFQVQSSTNVRANLAELNFQYKTARDSVSGVDINEELLNLTQYQKSYEAAVQIVRTMDQMLDELFQMI